jgi:hypothetical protein
VRTPTHAVCDFCGDKLDVTGLWRPYPLLYSQEWDWFLYPDGREFHSCGTCRDNRADEFNAARAKRFDKKEVD